MVIPMTEKKNKYSMHKKLTEYRAVILDMDGTLYSQPALRFLMAAALSGYYLFHPFRIKELFILKQYRQVREHWKGSATASDSLDAAQYLFTAEQMKAAPELVERVVTRWMQEYPLTFIKRCRDKKLAALIGQLRKKGMIIVVYSDYPAKEKLAALSLETDFVFCAADKEINCMKPDPKGMHAILHSLGLSAEEALMIGDRYEKDGLSAENAGMDFLILPRQINRRNKLENRIDLTPDL